MRRLPVYLLLDCSESMIGEGLAGLQQGVETMLRTLRQDPHALETVWLSCITFDKEAKLLFPLTELLEVQPPKLHVRPGTALGAALHLCADRIEKEVRKTTPTQKGDFRPLIILLTDGQPTDDWRTALQRLGQQVKPRPANLYAIGCGDDVHISDLRELTDIIFHMREMTEDRFRKLFVWLTASVTESSRGIHEEGAPGGGISLEKLPPEVLRVDHNYLDEWDGQQRQVLLFLKCTTKLRPYLIRYRWFEEEGVYHPTAVYPVELDPKDARAGFKLPAVSSAQLVGVPPCPHCGQQGAARCGNCGGLMCAEGGDDFEPITCPHCQQRLDSPGDGDSFDVQQSLA